MIWGLTGRPGSIFPVMRGAEMQRILFVSFFRRDPLGIDRNLYRVERKSYR